MNQTELDIKDFSRVTYDDIKKEDDHYRWSSCLHGRGTDSRLLKFCSVYLILLMVFTFCLSKLFYARTCDETTTYISLLTFLLGLVIKSPSTS